MEPVHNDIKKVVVIGGGTGSFVVLRGLKNYPFDISAVVTMFDSGGSSGVLRDEFGILPPGDARRCLIALSEGEKEETLRNLFNYRFNQEGSGLNGHNFGNILLTALTRIMSNEAEAIEEAGKILNIKGRVLPVSLTVAHLCAELQNGEIVEGETNIDIPKHEGSLKIKRVFLKPEAFIYEETAKAIQEADMIIIGPGDLYTSVIPNFLVEGVSKAIQKSKAKKIYIMNLMTKWGETHGFKASDFSSEIIKYLGIEKLDAIIVHDAVVSKELAETYAEQKQFPVVLDDTLKNYTARIITGDICDESSLLRHDSEKLAALISKV
ncbi:MAG: gluconeogenesis factor YvcK family protein [Patescibacteria group bacterium]